MKQRSWYTGFTIFERYVSAVILASIAGLLVAAAFFTSVPVVCILGAILAILIALAIGCFEEVTLKNGRDEEPVLVQLRYKWYCPSKKKTFKLANYKSMTIDNALARYRESHAGHLAMFFLSGGGLLWLFLGLDSGMKAGKWQLKLRREDLEVKTVFQHDNLERVKELANALKKAAGIPLSSS